MELSLLLMRISGILYLVLGLGLVFNQAAYKKIFHDLYKHTPVMLFMSFMMMIMGLLIVLHHNVWEFSAVGLVTFIGWGALVKGATLILFPGAFREWTGKMVSGPWYMFAVAFSLVLGLFLTYSGFFA